MKIFEFITTKKKDKKARMSEKDKIVNKICKTLCEDFGTCEGCVLNDKRLDECCTVNDDALLIYNAGFRQPVKGKWKFEINHFFNDYGDLEVYAVAYCSKCNMYYREEKTLAHLTIYAAEMGLDTDEATVIKEAKELLKNELKEIKLDSYCGHCGSRNK